MIDVQTRVSGILANLIEDQGIDPKLISDTVAKLNSDAIRNMMQGNTEQALLLFLTALEASGSNPELQAQCLINIGDWARRIPGNANLANEMFDLADLRVMSLITKSRALSMRAMVEVLPSETGHPDPEGRRRGITMLQRALEVAIRARTEDPERARAAESFAVHRWLGQVTEALTTKKLLGLAGTLSPDEEAMRAKALAISGSLNPIDPAERARLSYSEALLLAPTLPLEAAHMLLQSAEALRESSPLDTCRLYAQAGILMHGRGSINRANELLRKAEELEPLLSTHANSYSSLEDIRTLRDLLQQTRPS